MLQGTTMNTLETNKKKKNTVYQQRKIRIEKNWREILELKKFKRRKDQWMCLIEGWRGQRRESLNRNIGQ